MLLFILLALLIYFLFTNILATYYLLFICIAIIVAGIVLRHHRHLSIVALETLANRSKYKGINPIYKLLYTFSLIIFLIIAKNNTISIIIILASLYFIIIKNKISIRKYFDIIRHPLLFIVVSGIGIVLSINKEASGYFDIEVLGFYLSIIEKSQIDGLKLFLLSLGAINVLMAFSITTSIGDLLYSLKKIKLPELLIELAYLIYRYVLILSNLLYSMEHSSSLRGGFSNMKNTLATSKYIASRFFNRSIRISLDSYMAMESRLYSGNIRFLEGEYDKGIEVKSLLFLVFVVFLYCKAVVNGRI